MRVTVDGSALVVIGMYRPGSAKPTPQFFDDLTSLLEAVALLRCPLIIGGDFNIHVEDLHDVDAVSLAEIFELFGLAQRVQGVTHQHGGTLDLVVTSEDITDVPVSVDPPCVVSDHALVIADLPIRPVRVKPTPRTVRGWRSVDRDAFAKAIASTPLGRVPSADAAVDELSAQYNQVLSELADRFAPARVVLTRPRPLSPWFDAECRATRRTCRRLERQFRRSYSDAARQAWSAALREKHSLYETKKTQYWSTRLCNEGNNPRLLWRSLDSILRRGKACGLPTAPVAHSADDFQHFFQDKVNGVRAATADHSQATGSQPPLVAGSSLPSMTMWREVSCDEVRRIVLAAPPKSCSLDPIPTNLLRDCIDAILPYLTAMVNASLCQGCLPVSQKKAVVTPLLKKPSLDVHDLKNYRPVSNLSFVSKLVERVAVKQLVDYLEANELMPKLQSAYRKHHSTETAVLRVLSDILTAIDKQQVTLLALLDLSAAFDCVDHDILLSRLQSTFGLGGVTLGWIRSFLTDRSQRVLFNGSLSIEIMLLFGVPQGSVLGPLLFLLYAAGIFDVIESFGLSGHSYADDTQLYVSVPASESQAAAAKLAACVKALDEWMGSNRLKLNADKTQLIWIGTRQQLAKLTVTELQLTNSVVLFTDMAMDLGVVLDGQLSMSRQVAAVCRSCFFQIRQLKSVKSSLTREALHSLIQSFVHCRLDYCNSALAGVSKVYLQKLQSVQNTAARMVSGVRRCEHITPVLEDLHWLPISQRVVFKTALLVWKCVRGVAPVYLRDLCIPAAFVEGRQRLRSAATGALLVPRAQTATGQRSFAVNGPTVWNSLPPALRSPDLSQNTFKRALKTHLFSSVQRH